MKLAFLFPGQGSQKPNLLNELPDCPEVKNIIETITDLLNESVYNFHSAKALASTKAVQLTLLTAGVAAFKVFEAKGIKPDFVAGHSVGAYSAAVAAGVLDFKDAVKLVELRGELMERSYPDSYGMGVVLGLEMDKLKSIIENHSNVENPVFIGNQNAPDQLTVSGSLSGIDKVLEEARQNGARCASLLNVNTPSHCPLLTSVSQELNEALRDIPIHPPLIPYAGNRRARLLTNSVDIRLDLAESVASPVRWHDASSVLYEKGARLFIEMPPGTVLSKLAVKAFPEARVLSVSENGFDDCEYIAKRSL